MALLERGGEPFRAGQTLLLSFGWGIGAAIGVALGGWLTLVGGSGAPGVEALDPWTDLLLLPIGALGVVTVVHFVGRLVFASIRGHRARPDGNGDDQDPQTTGDQVAG